MSPNLIVLILLIINILIALGVLILFAVRKGWISQENTKCLNTNATDTKKAK